MDPRYSKTVADGIAEYRSALEKGTDLLLVLLVGSMILVVLGVLLLGCQSSQDIYLAQATNHATAADIEQALGHPTHNQALDAGQRWLYRRDGDGTGGRDFTPYCQDLWLTFDRERILRTWQKQRC